MQSLEPITEKDAEFEVAAQIIQQYKKIHAGQSSTHLVIDYGGVLHLATWRPKWKPIEKG
jgi:hypothetical protein